MGIVFRQSVKTTGVTFLGALLGVAVTYLSIKLIPTQEFGYLRILTSQAVVIAQIFMFGLNGTLAVFIHRYQPGDPRRSSLLTISFLVPTIAIGIGSVLYWILKPFVLGLYQAKDIGLVNHYFAWLPLFTLLFLYSALLEVYLTSQMRVALATFVREVVLRLINILIIILFGIGMLRFGHLVGGTVLAYAIPIVLFLWFALTKTNGFGFLLRSNSFEKAEYAEITHFTWYHSLLGVSLTLLGALDTLMLPWYDKNGLASAAVYSVAIVAVSIVQIPYKAMFSATAPVLTSAYRDNDMDKVRNLFRRSSENMLIATAVMALLMLCNLKNLTALLPLNYSALILLVPILLLGRLVDMATGMNDYVLSISNYYKFSFYFSLLLVVLLFVFCRFLIPLYGVYGAAAGTSASLIVYNVVKTVFVWKRLKMLPLSRRSLRTMLSFAATLAAVHFIPVIWNPYLDTLLRSLFIIVLYGSLLFWLKPSEDLQQYVQNVKAQRRLF